MFTRYCFAKLLKCIIQIQGQAQAQAQAQAQNRYAETDNRDWRARSAQPPPANEEKSWDNIREAKEAYASSGRQQEQANRQDQLSSQFASKAQVPSRSTNSSTSFAVPFYYSIICFLPCIFIIVLCCCLYFSLWLQVETDLVSYPFTTNVCLMQLFPSNFVTNFILLAYHYINVETIYLTKRLT